MRKTLLALALPFLLCTLAHAASFDCTKSKTAQEKAICATPDLSAADDQMAAAYKAWLAAAQPDWAAGIRQDQLVWLRTRDTNCLATESSADLDSCLSNVYKDRIGELQGMVQHIGGVTFVSKTITLTARDTPDSAPPAGISEVTPGYGTLEALLSAGWSHHAAMDRLESWRRERGDPSCQHIHRRREEAGAGLEQPCAVRRR